MGRGCGGLIRFRLEVVRNGNKVWSSIVLAATFPLTFSFREEGRLLHQVVRGLWTILRKVFCRLADMAL